MTDAELPIDRSIVGRPFDPFTFTVTAERIAQYAAATNDPFPDHREGTAAPAVFAVLPVWDANADALSRVIPAELLLQVLHGEQDIHLHRQIRAGDELTSVATLVGVHTKTSGTTPVVKIDTTDADGALVAEQYFVTFIRGVSEGDSVGEPAPPHVLPDDVKTTDPVEEITQDIDPDQSLRYAPASGDMNPIHTDDDVARSVGLPGMINHGLCTMAFTSWAAVGELAGSDPSRLRRLAVRFSKPVIPGESITTRFWALSDESRPGVSVFGFETTDPAGDVVVKDGRVELAG